MRLIDADKLVDMLYDNEFASLCPLDEVSGVIDACPTVDAVPVVHGRWERSENKSNDYAFSLTDEEAWYYWQCSACHEDICCHEEPMRRSLLPKYCPNCGAKCDDKGDG